MNYENPVGFFNLNNDGDTAIIRILHSSVSTIESAQLHKITIGDKKKSVKCVGEGCPCCAKNNAPFDRIFIHLFDYSDGQEKLWSRTPVILKQLDELEKAWGDLSKIVLKITRSGKEFPKYELMVLPGNSYGPAPENSVDVKLGYRCYMHRTADELNKFYETGVMPPHETKPFVPKEEYFKNKPTAEKTGRVIPTDNAPKVNAVVDDDPFLDPFSTTVPRRV